MRWVQKLIFLNLFRNLVNFFLGVLFCSLVAGRPLLINMVCNAYFFLFQTKIKNTGAHSVRIDDQLRAIKYFTRELKNSPDKKLFEQL